jgi:hypothetical protein
MDHKINILTISFGQALEINPSFDKDMPPKDGDVFDPSRRLRKQIKVALCSSCNSSVCSPGMTRDAEMHILFRKKFPKSCDQIKNQSLVSEIMGS